MGIKPTILTSMTNILKYEKKYFKRTINKTNLKIDDILKSSLLALFLLGFLNYETLAENQVEELADKIVESFVNEETEIIKKFIESNKNNNLFGSYYLINSSILVKATLVLITYVTMNKPLPHFRDTWVTYCSQFVENNVSRNIRQLESKY